MQCRTEMNTAVDRTKNGQERYREAGLGRKGSGGDARSCTVRQKSAAEEKQKGRRAERLSVALVHLGGAVQLKVRA